MISSYLPASRILSRNSLLLLAILLVSATVIISPAAASDLRRSAIVQAVEKASPAVVNIHGRKTVRNRSSGRNTQPSERHVNGMGTGIIFDERGYILTNFHVVQGVESIVVTQHDKSTNVATLVAHDQATDLAIIKIPSKTSLPTIQTGNSLTLMPGETVIAVGNAYGYQHTVTRGIISALNRNVQVNETQRYANLIQTDASINPGNSGGPLLNIDGEMIGVNVAVRIGAQGIGFAIPSNDALAIAARLLASTRPDRTIGLLGDTRYSGETSRYVVKQVLADSIAAEKGIQTGDVILEIAGVTVHNGLDFERGMLAAQPNGTISIRVARDTEQLSFALTSRPQRKASTAELWEQLGLRLTTVPRNRLGNHQGRYRGGLRVKEVRSGSLAAKNGIRVSDVLLGIHKWETVSMDNLTYILTSPDFLAGPELKFYLLRNQQVLFGHLSKKSSD
jgi:serine protease Do